MTIEELKALAVSGNLAAAEDLADHYRDEDEYELAYSYYDMAAQDSRNWVAGYNAMIASRLVACDYMQKRDYREATAYFDHTIRWAKKLYEGEMSTLIDAQDRENVRDGLEASTYLYCLASYSLGNMNDILRMLPNPRESKTKILHGVALHRNAVGLADYQEAFDFETSVESGSFQPQFWEEQVFYCEAVVNLASFYQTGLPGRVAKDMEHSVKLLKDAIIRVSDSEIKKALQEELSKYRPKLFGGYTYRE